MADRLRRAMLAQEVARVLGECAPIGRLGSVKAGGAGIERAPPAACGPTPQPCDGFGRLPARSQPPPDTRPHGCARPRPSGATPASAPASGWTMCAVPTGTGPCPHSDDARRGRATLFGMMAITELTGAATATIRFPLCPRLWLRRCGRSRRGICAWSAALAGDDASREAVARQLVARFDVDPRSAVMAPRPRSSGG